MVRQLNRRQWKVKNIADELYRVWWHVCIAGRGRADPHAMRNESEKGLPVVGVDYGYSWNRSAQNTDDVVEEKTMAVIRLTASGELASLVWMKPTKWVYFLLIASKATATTKENIAVISQDLMAGGCKRQIVRTDGEAAMVSHVRVAILATMADAAIELIQEQTSKGPSLENGLADGAVKEERAQIRTLRYDMERGLSRTVLENHDTLAWLVQHVAATIIALAWTDEHRSKGERARDLDEWRHRSGRKSCGWQLAKSRVGSAQVA